MRTIKTIKESCIVQYGDMKLTPLHDTDIENLRKWRNDESQTKFLRKIGVISEKAQRKWFDEYLDDDSQIVFAINEISELNKMVGSVAIYNIDLENHICEVGKIQIGEADAHGRGLGRKSLVGVIKVAFRCLDITRIVASVHQDNVQAHTNDLKIGFRIVGEIDSVVGGKEDLLEMFEDDVISANSYYKDIVIK